MAETAAKPPQMDENMVIAAIKKMFGGGDGDGKKKVVNGKPVGDPNNPGSMEDSLDVFKGMFDNTPKEGAVTAPKFSINPEALTAAAGKLDFSKSLPPELLAKIQAGDGAAMMEGMQSMARHAYQTAIQHTTGVADQYINSRLAYENDHVMPGRMRELLASQSSGDDGDNEMMSNPVVKDHLKLITSNLVRQYPEADAKWIQDKAKGYFTDMAKAVNPKAFAEGKGTNGQGKGNIVANEAVDWQGWLEGKKAGSGDNGATGNNPNTGEIPS